MHAFDILGDPVRRRILELLAGGELSSGDIVAVIGGEFGISQSAVSQHLRVLRDHGFASVRHEGARRIYAVQAGPLLEIDAWLDSFRGFWLNRLEALDTEIARGKRQRRDARRQQKASAEGKPPNAKRSASKARGAKRAGSKQA